MFEAIKDRSIYYPFLPTQNATAFALAKHIRDMRIYVPLTTNITASSTLSLGVKALTQTTLTAVCKEHTRLADILNNYVVSSGMSMYIGRHGIATSAFVAYGGIITVEAGGVLRNATASAASALIVVANNGSAYDTIVDLGGSCHIQQAGVCYGTTVHGYGTLVVDADGRAENTTVSAQGEFTVLSAGHANNTTLLGPALSATVVAGGTMTNTTLTDIARLYVYGLCSTVIPSNLAYTHVNSGGVALDVWLNPDTTIYVSAHGSAEIAYTPWASGSIVSSAGATITYAARSAKIYVGSANKMVSRADTWESGTLGASMTCLIYSGGVASAITITESTAIMRISSGGLAGGDIAISAGTVCALESGQLRGVTAGSRANIRVDGGTATGLSLADSAYMYAYNGGTVSNGVLKADSIFRVSAGGSAVGTEIRSGGTLMVSTGGLSLLPEIHSSGRVRTYSGGVTESAYVYGAGELYIHGSGSASHVDIRRDGYMFIFSNGQASGILVESNGSLTISSGGSACGVVSANGAKITVRPGGYIDPPLT